MLRREAVRGSREEPVKVVPGTTAGRYVKMGFSASPNGYVRVWSSFFPVEDNTPALVAPPAQQPRLFSYGKAGATVVQRMR